MNKRILVLGGAGFLGRSIINSLIYNDFAEIGCVDLQEVEIDNVEYYNVDLLNITELDKIIKNFDLVINCSGQITKPINICYSLNTSGMTNIIDCVIKHEAKLIQISTVAVYGTANYVDEETEVNPETPYGVMKACSEFLIKYLMSKNNYAILRLSNLYGENQQKGIISYISNSADLDKPLFFNNNGDLTRYYLNVEDCAQIISDLIKCENIHGIFNIKGPDKYSIKSLISIIESLIDRKLNVNYELIKPIENIEKLSDNKMMSKLLVSYKHSVNTFLAKKIMDM